MAIVKMKKLRVMAMAADQERLLHQLQHLGCVEISQPSEEVEDTKWASRIDRKESQQVQIRVEMSEAQSALAAVKEYSAEKSGVFSLRRRVTEEELLQQDTLRAGRRAAGRIHTELDTLARIDAEESRLLSRQNALLPWKDLNMPMELQESAHVVFRPCVFPAAVDLEGIRTRLSGEELPAELIGVSQDRQQRYALLICHKSAQEDAVNLLRESGFSAVTLPEPSGTPAEALKAIDQELEACRKKREESRAKLAASGKDKGTLQLYLDHLSAQEALAAGDESLLNDGTVTFFEGWCPAENLPQVEALLESMGCAWEASDPTKDDVPQVPVKLKNNWLTKPLNMVTEMYSLPAYDNVDPNPLMAPFFILFYGIMLADMGYGLLMILAGLFVTKKYHPKGTMGNKFGQATICGISTFIMGALTGGFFGDFLTQLVKLTTGGNFVLPALFTPLNDTLMILLGSMCLGLVQIITGMAISFIRKLKAHQYLDALFEEATWWVVFAGIGCMALGITNLVLYAGIALVIVGPLITGKGMGKIMGIFGSIYNHVTGYFGDILSYARLMALMLAGSVIAQVFNTLGAIPGSLVIFLVISFAGNALNFALNLLGCYVHDLRLQCLEYFGKFYEDGGKPFRPLAINAKYVDIEKA